MRLTAHVCMTLLGCGMLVAGAAGQGSDASKLRTRQGPPVRTIHLNVVVTSKSGVPVGGLEEKDFTVVDNKAVQPITSFKEHDGQKEPIEMIVLMDNVNSGFETVAQERIGIEKFLRANGGKLTHPTALAVLTDRGMETQGAYSYDGNALADALDKYDSSLRIVNRSAGVEGAAEELDDSLKALKTLVAYELGRPHRKLILWVSPGWPLLSGPNINLSYMQQEGVFSDITWFSTELREAQITIDNVNPLGVDEGPGRTFMYMEYLKGITKPGEDAMGNLALQVLATQTGGQVVSSTDIAASLTQCAADTGAYYEITFEPPPVEHRDVYHRLEVKVDRPGLTAHTNTGYYAEP